MHTKASTAKSSSNGDMQSKWHRSNYFRHLATPRTNAAAAFLGFAVFGTLIGWFALEEVGRTLFFCAMLAIAAALLWRSATRQFATTWSLQRTPGGEVGIVRRGGPNWWTASASGIACVAWGALIILSFDGPESGSNVAIAVSACFAAMCGVLVWLPRRDRQGSIDDDAVEAHLTTQRSTARGKAVRALRIREDLDVIEGIVLFGPRFGEFIPGERRTLRGIRADTSTYWFPYKFPPGRSPVCAQYEFHSLFADEKGIYYQTLPYDFIEDRWGEAHSARQGRVFFRDIENVEVTQSGLSVHTTGGRTHDFPMSIRLYQEAYKMDEKVVSPPILWDEGRAFASALMQLRNDQV
jgi:hypothetical protein